MNSDLIYRYMCFNCDRDTPDVTGGMNVQQFAEYLDQTDPIVHLNDDMIMVGRVSILLRGTPSLYGSLVQPYRHLSLYGSLVHLTSPDCTLYTW